jgi:O-antigen/teichoic acid export membrane protein
VRELGLERRVTLHGYVDESTKRELLRSAWAQVTASAAEGWGLTITEAAAAGSASGGIATGGLREAIIHERTGLLARDADELAAHLRRLTGDRELVERLGSNARERVRELTWERTAATTLEALDQAVSARPEPRPRWRRLLGADVVRAAGLAAAVLANSAIALLCTVVFARWLGADRYGTLASLLSAFLILTVLGSALQVTVARDVSRDPGGAAEALARRALSAVLLLAVPVALVLVLVRAQIADVLGVHLEWAAAATVWFGWLWIALSLERGLLQGRRRYRPLGVSLIVEATGRLLFGVGLLALGLGATGALLGTGFAIAAAFGVMIAVDPLRRQLGRPRDLWQLARRCGAPLAALSLVAVLQNVDTILVRHRMSSAAAGLYSEAAVAARGILWFGVGLGLFLLPEAARLSRRGADARPILAQMIGLVCVVAAPLIIAYGVAGTQVMRFVFGNQHNLSSLGAALPLLSVAMALLAISYLAVQYLLALKRRSFILPLAVAAVVESVAVLVAEPSFQRVALAIIGVQALLLVVLLTAALGQPRRRAAEEPVVAEKAVAV